MTTSLRFSPRPFAIARAVAAFIVLLFATEAPHAASSFPLHDGPRALPEVRFQDGGGADRSLADFRGKVVLLNIWATWCVPCRKEMPQLDRLQAALGEQDFEVVPLSIDRGGIPVVEKFYEEVGLKTLRMYIDPGGRASRVLGMVGLPTTILIGRDGLELGRHSGPAEWDSTEMIEFFRKQIEKRASNREPAESVRRIVAIGLMPTAVRAALDPGNERIVPKLDLPVTGNVIPAQSSEVTR